MKFVFLKRTKEEKQSDLIVGLSNGIHLFNKHDEVKMGLIREGELNSFKESNVVVVDGFKKLNLVKVFPSQQLIIYTKQKFFDVGSDEMEIFKELIKNKNVKVICDSQNVFNDWTNKSNFPSIYFVTQVDPYSDNFSKESKLSLIDFEEVLNSL